MFRERIIYWPNYEPKRKHYEFIIGRHFNYNTNQFEDTKIIMRSWGNNLAEAMPRYGKSVLMKDLTIKISKVRKVIIFDYAGEWKHSIFKYNPDAPYPIKMNRSQVKILENFTFNILAFTNKEDFISMGFNELQAPILADIINEAKDVHKGNIDRISEILSDLPVSQGAQIAFNRRYHTTLISPLFTSTKTGISTRWGIIRKYFWQGEDDTRTIYDFPGEFQKKTHIIIDLSRNDQDFDKGMKRAYAGKILEQIRQFPKLFIDTKPVFVFEEARMLFPYQDESSMKYSTNIQIYNMVTHDPKKGVAIFFIVQHEKQIYESILENIHDVIAGRVQNPTEWLKKILKETRLRYDPEHNIREFLYLPVTSDRNNPTYIKFRPVIPGMFYNSDL